MATYQSKKPYMYGTGRRKSSVARVHLFPGGTGSITVNGREIDDYFGLETLKLIVRQPLVTTSNLGKVDIEATVAGGGVTGQAVDSPFHQAFGDKAVEAAHDETDAQAAAIEITFIIVVHAFFPSLCSSPAA